MKCKVKKKDLKSQGAYIPAPRLHLFRKQEQKK